ncbi:MULTISPECIES: hypothetical protein [Pseudomonas]|uniref:Uncharacterized protein n=1 Tax=Pseudomonas brassicacearum (strain NFM421) TaxID=994484 RepID=F2KKP5_PSEBN|nr:MULTISPECIES: hypothetical protein [Pseudomonas]KIR14771.1 hypothetical protein PFLU4_42020 [Pseudomonas fluorescens]AEA70777.1 Conserved hypothetical protein; putative exported protein [Pseudomonas brassicacearum subsp. brassicacearum NFM421]AOS41591.1 hypothetical protein A0U95_23295 [Pseudomonas brassicacearum]KAB0526466.1 hypothetical protein F7R20_08675 [Pseudomonas brassicacearum subsp. brassicacearum]KQW08978.1 hypothetical protein ASC85_14390 [Pseudomonas sp. Root401]
MKLEIARGLFLVGALAVASMAVAVWEQPRSQILSASNADAHCPLPRVAKVSETIRPDNDLLLFMFSLSQGMRPQS